MWYNSLVKNNIREHPLIMGLFGRKKEQKNEPVENKTNNSISDEMKIILAAREEDKQEKIERAEERQQAQKEADEKFLQIEEQAKGAAERILKDGFAPKGMTFFMLCDEVPFDAAPEKEGNIIVKGNVRGTIKNNTEVFLYQDIGGRYSVKIEKIRNDSREYVDELTDGRAELEITRGDIPLPTDPDEDASKPVKRFAVISDAVGIEDTKDPACKGMVASGNPRTIAMLCEYGKYGDEPIYFSMVMDCLMTSEFVTPAKIGPAKNGRSNVGFIGVSPKQHPDKSFLPVFTDNRLCIRAMKNSFSKQGGPDQRISLSFAQVAAISKDQNHHGFLVNPGGPVTITIPKDLVEKMVESQTFIERFGHGAGDNASLALGGTGSRALDNFIANGGPDVPGVEPVLISNPSDTPEFSAIENMVKKYCGAHSDIAKVLILVLTPQKNRNDKAYLCIMDCPDGSFEANCNGLAGAIKPFLKGIKRIQFQQFSKMNKEGFPKKVQWLYSKLPQ